MKISEKYSTSETSKIIKIIDAKYIGDFAIRVTFDDGYMKLVDFKPFLQNASHPSIIKYLNENVFKGFNIKDGNLDWNDFELCFPVIDFYKNNILKEEVVELIKS